MSGGARRGGAGGGSERPQAESGRDLARKQTWRTKFLCNASEPHPVNQLIEFGTQ